MAMGAPPTRFERAELRGEDTGLLVAQDGGVPCAGVPNVLTRSTAAVLRSHMASKLYVGNLPFSASENDVRDLFAQYGEVHSVKLVSDRDTGRPRGFGFVEMDNADEAQQALDNYALDGRNLKVNEARDRGGPRGGGGGGRW